MRIKVYSTLAQKAKRKTAMYLNTEEKRELLNVCGSDGFVLLDFYFSRAGIPNYIFTDKKTAKALGWTERRTQTIRLRLIKAGYYKQATANYTDGDKVLTTFLGKTAVKTKSSIKSPKLIKLHEKYT